MYQIITEGKLYTQVHTKYASIGIAHALEGQGYTVIIKDAEHKTVYKTDIAGEVTENEAV